MDIGIDMGGTKIAGGLVSNGKIVKRITVPTNAHKGKAVVIKQLRSVVETLSAGKKIDGIGIGVPGLFKGTKIVELANVPVLNGLDLKKALKAKKLVLENDARCFALAEHMHGAGKGSKNMIGLIIGTGLGSGIIINNRIYKGSHGSAGEVGHQFTRWGNIWEHELAGPGIVRRHKERGGKEDGVTAIWGSHDKKAKETREETILLLSTFIANLQTVFDLDMIVLGGGVTKNPIAKDVNAFLKIHKHPLHEKIVVKQGKLGDDAGIIGAVVALHS